MRKWEIRRYTLSQVLEMLADDGSGAAAAGAHPGGASDAAIADLEAHWRRAAGAGTGG